MNSQFKNETTEARIAFAAHLPPHSYVDHSLATRNSPPGNLTGNSYSINRYDEPFLHPPFAT